MKSVFLLDVTDVIKGQPTKALFRVMATSKDVVAESVQHRPPFRVKEMTHKIDTHHFLVWRSESIGHGKDWLSQCQDNVTEWDIGS